MFGVRIRKSDEGIISSNAFGILGSLFVIIFSIIGIYVIYSMYPNLFHSIRISGINNMIIPIVEMVVFFIILIIRGYSFRNSLKVIKVKKYKQNGLGEVKLVKVTSIEEYHQEKIHVYYVEAKDGDMIYCSDGYLKGNIGGVPRERMEEIYRKYGFEFDENETYKQDVLEEIDKRIGELQYEIESNEGYFKNQITKYTLYTDKKEKNTVESGYQPAYWEVNGHRITVGDTVTVYIDPENPKYYWMDIDFLFEK